MVPVEAMACGRPVIAYGRGGATETVVEGMSGVFFAEQTIEAISSAVKKLAAIDIDPAKIAAHASQFGRAPFLQTIHNHIDALFVARANRRAATSSTRVHSNLDRVDQLDR